MYQVFPLRLYARFDLLRGRPHLQESGGAVEEHKEEDGNEEHPEYGGGKEGNTSVWHIF